MAGNNTHQSYQGMPQVDTPLVDEAGRMTRIWTRVFTTLMQRVGMTTPGQAQTAGVGSIQNGVVIGQTPQGAGAPLSAFDAATGEFIGTILVSNPASSPAQPQTLGASPFTFTAPSSGTLVAFSGKVEISRDSGSNYYTVSLTGGATTVLAGDLVRITWTGLTPQVTFFPILI